MYQGKHSTQNENKKTAASRPVRRVALILALVLILGGAVGGTVAYFMDSDFSSSSLEIGKVECTVRKAEDTYDYTVTNTGNTSAYIRVAVVANWVDNSGAVHYTQPAVTVTSDDDSAVEIVENENDGFYYSKSAVAAGSNVTFSVGTSDTKPTGYELQVQILAEAIQENAAAEVWGYPSSGN